MIDKIKSFAIAHKWWSAIIALVIIFFGYQIVKAARGNSGATSYVTAAVAKGAVIVSVSGSGQVAASNQVDIKAKAGGDVIYIGVKAGQTVGSGALIASLDPKTALDDLTSAKLSLAKLEKPADPADILSSQNSLESAKQSLTKAYDDSWSNLDSAFLNLPNTLSSLDDLLNSYQSGKGYLNDTNVRSVGGDTAGSYRDKAAKSYWLAKTAYDRTLLDYRDASRKSDPTQLDSLMSETYDTVKLTGQALADAARAVDFIRTQTSNTALQTQGNTTQSNLTTLTNETSSDLASILSIKNSVDNANRDISQKQAALDKLQRGADDLDIQAQELTVKQREQAYADYFIRAPFAGTIAKLDIKAFDSVSSGAVVATLITSNQEADISLNEVDAAKVQVGQKATLTFDAVPDLTLTGQVTQLDQIGTITQGVVTYEAKITLDSTDARVKPGMSVNAAIITDLKQDVLTVPNSAVKSQNGSYYVQILVNGTPTQQPVEVGLANDTVTEITSGLKESDQVISRTITSATTAAAAPAPSLFGNIGGNRGGGGVRPAGARIGN